MVTAAKYTFSILAFIYTRNNAIELHYLVHENFLLLFSVFHASTTDFVVFPIVFIQIIIHWFEIWIFLFAFAFLSFTIIFLFVFFLHFQNNFPIYIDALLLSDLISILIILAFLLFTYCLQYFRNCFLFFYIDLFAIRN